MATFGFQHVHNVASGVIAEKLTKRFLVIGDVMLLDEGDEIRWSVPGQG
jgi:hypothetical protein